MMRRFEESQNDDLRRSVKLGEDNAECLRQMQSWCRHVEIERTSEGLYAQITGLPIASHSIACPKVEGKTGSMNLRWIFSDFLVQHCATCPHHAPNGDLSWGQEIIDKHRGDIQEREQADKEEADRISKLRSELRSKSKDISAETAPESHRVLKYLEAVFSEDEAKRNELSERLKQSARLGADLFPDAAINLILQLAGSNDFSELMLPVCTELARRHSDLGSRLSKVALDNIEKGLYPELSASVLDMLGSDVAYPLSKVHIEQLLFLQNHSLFFSQTEEEPKYPHSTAIIVQSFDAEPDSVQNIVRRGLQNENEAVRFQLCGAIRLIQNHRPQFVDNLLGDLIRALEFYENTRSGEERSSIQIIQILQLAFRYSTKKVDKFLVESMAYVRPAVQEDIVRVYRYQFLDQRISWKERSEQRSRTEVSEPEKVAIQRLLAWAKDEDIEIDIRVEAFEALGVACDYAGAEMLDEFESLLGYFAIVSSKEHPPDPPSRILLPNQPQNTQLEQLDEFSRTQQWNNFKQRLRTCLKKICETKPLEAFDIVFDCLDNPLEDLENDFKAGCVLLLGELGKDYRLQPHVLPLIWRKLMDYDSAWVRSQAIDAIVEMFSSSTASPPANMVDIIIVHLQDPKVVVHQTALRAVSRCPSWFDESQSIEVLNCLAQHLKAYSDDKYQLDDICCAILRIGCQNGHLKLFSLSMVESVFPVGEEHVDAKIAEQLIWFCEPDDVNAALVAKDIGTYLATHDRDHYNYYGHSERLRMFEWLHKLPEETYQNAADDLLASARKMAKRDAWETCHFASLFSHFRMFRYEQIVLEDIANALPKEPRHESFRTSLYQLAILAAGNAALQADKVEMADTYFSKIKDKER